MVEFLYYNIILIFFFFSSFYESVPFSIVRNCPKVLEDKHVDTCSYDKLPMWRTINNYITRLAEGYSSEILKSDKITSSDIHIVAIVHRPYGVKVIRANGSRAKRSAPLISQSLRKQSSTSPLEPFFLVRLHIFTEQHLRANPSAVTLITTVQRVRMVFPALTLPDSLLFHPLPLHSLFFWFASPFHLPSFFFPYSSLQYTLHIRTWIHHGHVANYPQERTA